ncbi:hypothetical protein Pla111_07080 [Botrimarina hoheduenensis]|uniref:Uncharacterized protein n=2 Tax=Botrimarina hoheduenensis TaxID=2528000 RepID=A0A5C5WE94_9BACT|nr:hypothetical protein Pla111_07080 [Botrimarina hoheduenensis]
MSACKSKSTTRPTRNACQNERRPGHRHGLTKTSVILLTSVAAVVSLLLGLALRSDLSKAAERRSMWERQQTLEEASGRRWWAINFYATTVYEPGDFPKEGYFREDGTPWTPEGGGACFDAKRNLLQPHLDLDPEADRGPFGLGFIGPSPAFR